MRGAFLFARVCDSESMFQIFFDDLDTNGLFREIRLAMRVGPIRVELHTARHDSLPGAFFGEHVPV
jgi:hypothetical protein